MCMRTDEDTGRRVDDNPFEYNPFMAYKGAGGDGARKQAPPADDAGTVEDGETDTGSADDEPSSDDAVLSVITGDDDDGDGTAGDDGVDAITAMAGDADPGDDGYDSMGRDRRRRTIVVIASIVAVLALLAAIIWALGTNPLHIGELDGDYPPQDGGSQEFRGSGCRIDGQSCSSDDNGNHPAD